jgi:hypothetical protein
LEKNSVRVDRSLNSGKKVFKSDASTCLTVQLLPFNISSFHDD